MEWEQVALDNGVTSHIGFPEDRAGFKDYG